MHNSDETGLSSAPPVCSRALTSGACGTATGTGSAWQHDAPGEQLSAASLTALGARPGRGSAHRRDQCRDEAPGVRRQSHEGASGHHVHRGLHARFRASGLGAAATSRASTAAAAPAAVPPRAAPPPHPRMPQRRPRRLPSACSRCLVRHRPSPCPFARHSCFCVPCAHCEPEQ